MSPNTLSRVIACIGVSFATVALSACGSGEGSDTPSAPHSASAAAISQADLDALVGTPLVDALETLDAAGVDAEVPAGMNLKDRRAHALLVTDAIAPDGLGPNAVVYLKGETLLETAARACGASTWISDGGYIITFDTLGNDDAAMDVIRSATEDEVLCTLDAVGAPSIVSTQVSSTTGADGLQTAKWGDYSANWAYDFGTGLGLIIEVPPF